MITLFLIFESFFSYHIYSKVCIFLILLLFMIWCCRISRPTGQTQLISYLTRDGGEDLKIFWFLSSGWDSPRTAHASWDWLTYKDLQLNKQQPIVSGKRKREKENEKCSTNQHNKIFKTRQKWNKAKQGDSKITLFPKIWENNHFFSGFPNDLFWNSLSQHNWPSIKKGSCSHYTTLALFMEQQ